MIRFSCYFIILDLVFILSCLNKTEKINFVNKNEPEKFENFLNRFNTDENFRNSRIITPLSGYNSDDFEDDY